MANVLPKLDARRADFGDLRDAYLLTSDILNAGGLVSSVPKGLAFQNIPKDLAGDFRARLKGRESAVAALVGGMGEKKSIEGQIEIVLSVVGKERQEGSKAVFHFEICALKVRARGPVLDCLVVSTLSPGWREALRTFTDWKNITGVICAADGNNQRASIGAVLAAAEIGRGGLPLIEMEVPQEIDESTHLVRGAEWMKAGLPRFLSAASEALWYLLRARSLHSRMFRDKKQGYYSSMAVLALFASGVQPDAIAQGLKMPLSLVEKFLQVENKREWSKDDRAFFEADVFRAWAFPQDAPGQAALDRIWKGPALYVRGMDWRLRVSRQARMALYKGGDLVEIAENLRIQRRELVRILSQTTEDGDMERSRFLAAVPKPQAFAGLIEETSRG